MSQSQDSGDETEEPYVFIYNKVTRNLYIKNMERKQLAMSDSDNKTTEYETKSDLRNKTSRKERRINIGTPSIIRPPTGIRKKIINRNLPVLIAAGNILSKFLWLDLITDDMLNNALVQLQDKKTCAEFVLVPILHTVAIQYLLHAHENKLEEYNKLVYDHFTPIDGFNVRSCQFDVMSDDDVRWRLLVSRVLTRRLERGVSDGRIRKTRDMLEHAQITNVPLMSTLTELVSSGYRQLRTVVFDRHLNTFNMDDIRLIQRSITLVPSAPTTQYQAICWLFKLWGQPCLDSRDSMNDTILLPIFTNAALHRYRLGELQDFNDEVEMFLSTPMVSITTGKYKFREMPREYVQWCRILNRMYTNEIATTQSQNTVTSLKQELVTINMGQMQLMQMENTVIPSYPDTFDEYVCALFDMWGKPYDKNEVVRACVSTEHAYRMLP